MGPIRNLDALMNLGNGFQRSMTLLGAIRLGVFRGLADGPRDAPGLALEIGADPLVHMAAVTEAGTAYSAGEIAAITRKAGFRNSRTSSRDRVGVGIVRGTR